MIDEILKKAFDEYYEAPLEVWKYLAGQGEQVACSKKEIIKQAEKKEQYGYFLIKGAVGSFIWNNDSQNNSLRLH